MWLLAFAAVAVAGGQACWAQSDFLAVEQTIEPRIPVQVPPGEVAEFEIVLRNDGEQALADVVLRGTHTNITFDGEGWTFHTLSPPPCDDIRFDPGVNNLPPFPPGPIRWHYELDIEQVDPGERLICRYRVERDGTSTRDMSLAWTAALVEGIPVSSAGSAAYVLGSLAKIDLSLRPLCSDDPDSGQRLVEVTAHNEGPTDVEGLRIGSCFTHPLLPSYRISGEVEGGCGTDAVAPVACFETTGMPSFSIGWTLGDVSTGESRGCLIMLDDSEDLPGTDTFHIETQSGYSNGPLSIAEIDPTTNQALLSVSSPPPACGVAQPVAVPLFADRRWPVAILFCLLILATAHRATHRF